ncbi:MAG: DNA polymerase III subunit delta [Planctomycetes bacterium]|nr:DNA polymerase III subunit delta [Planctomycetota bacterium]
MPIYVIFGAEDFLRLRAMNALISRIIGPARDDMALAEFDGDNALLADVLDEVRTPSLLAPVRMVIVRDADEFVSENRDGIERFLTKPPPKKDAKVEPPPPITGVLVLVCRSWSKSTRLYKIVDALGGNIPCDSPKANEVPGWLVAHARSAYGCTLDGAAARRLVDLVGPSLGLLDMELSKLATYVMPKTMIGMTQIEELVGASREEKVFGITDCIARRDAKGALAMWEQVIATDRDAPYRSIGGLAYGFRKLAEGKRLMKQGLAMPEVAKRAGLWGDLTQIKRQLERFSLTQWQDHLVKLLRLDVASKTGLGHVSTSVERFIVELCSAA